MDFEKAQKAVDDWISQFKTGYFEDAWKVVSFVEEVGELAEVIENNEPVEKELGDVVFPLICCANSHHMKLQNKHYNQNLQLNQYITKLFIQVTKYAREINHMYGPKRKKPEEETQDLQNILEETIGIIEKIGECQNISLEYAFKIRMDKLYKRDNDRWERKEK